MQLADFESHRIEGFARQGNTPFSVPLFSRIEHNLWSGGCPTGMAPQEFRFIVSLYPWEPYKRHDHQVYTESRLFDASEMPDEGLLHALADWVNTVRKLGPTLVHCQAGLNRSGLITALALIKDGKTPQEAIDLLRTQRCDAVLCNKTFENWLHKQ